MYPYSKEMLSRLKYRFPGDERIEKNYSQSLQDMFVLAALQGKRYGYFLDIGARHSTYLNNTYLLERDFEWGGLTMSTDSRTLMEFNHRKSSFVLDDATGVNWKRFLPYYFGTRIEYLSLAIKPNTEVVKCLKRFPFGAFRFSVITCETDFYDPGTDYSKNFTIRNESREILTANGYTLVAGNLSKQDDNHPFEDWYLDSTHFEEEYITPFLRVDDAPLSAGKYMLYEH